MALEVTGNHSEDGRAFDAATPAGVGWGSMWGECWDGFVLGLGVVCIDFKVVWPRQRRKLPPQRWLSQGQPRFGWCHRKFRCGMHYWATKTSICFASLGTDWQRQGAGWDWGRMRWQLNSWQLRWPARGWKQLGAKTVTYSLVLQMCWKILVTGAYCHLRSIFGWKGNNKIAFKFSLTDKMTSVQNKITSNRTFPF